MTGVGGYPAHSHWTNAQLALVFLPSPVIYRLIEASSCKKTGRPECSLQRWLCSFLPIQRPCKMRPSCAAASDSSDYSDGFHWKKAARVRLTASWRAIFLGNGLGIPREELLGRRQIIERIGSPHLGPDAHPILISVVAAWAFLNSREEKPS